ncbi:hypothetical protein BVY01_03130 [bacterium I07]|nr:hypothetical protein BVY01_03130 [bacterium I07]
MTVKKETESTQKKETRTFGCNCSCMNKEKMSERMKGLVENGTESFDCSKMMGKMFSEMNKDIGK